MGRAGSSLERACPAPQVALGQHLDSPKATPSPKPAEPYGALFPPWHPTRDTCASTG